MDQKLRDLSYGRHTGIRPQLGLGLGAFPKHLKLIVSATLATVDQYFMGKWSDAYRPTLYN